MKHSKILLFVLAAVFCACSDSEQTTQENEYKPLSLPMSQSRVSAQTNNFSYTLFDAAVKNQGNANVIISPLSANLTLSMLDNAVAGSSRTELTRALGFGDDLESLNAYNKSLLAYLPGADNTAELYLPNSLWVTTDNIKSDFKTKLSDLYFAETNCITRQVFTSKINSWVAEKTKGNITSILDNNEGGDFAFLNCMYFKGTWTVPFDSEKTVKDDFKNFDGTVSRQEYMNGEHAVDNIGGENYTAVSVPFGNKAFSLDIFLPDEGYTTEDVIANLKSNGIPEFRNKKQVKLKFPKVSLTNRLDLIPVMKSLGVNGIFSLGADFSPMLNDENAEMIIGILRQANSFEIDEKGAKVASATVAVGETTGFNGVTEKFEVTRPFVFLVREQSTKAVLLAGRINKL